jgi:hypothetical protein
VGRKENQEIEFKVGRCPANGFRFDFVLKGKDNLTPLPFR